MMRNLQRFSQGGRASAPLRRVAKTGLFGSALVAPAAGALLFCGLALTSTPARADTTIAGDLDVAVPINAGDGISAGPGFGIRIGSELHVPALTLTPELGFTYAHLSGDIGPKVYRGIAGLRLGVGEILRPGVFAHVGIGHVSYDLADASYTGFTFDGGAFLDFTLLPLLNIGVHAAYNREASKDQFDAFGWATLGAHAALVF